MKKTAMLVMLVPFLFMSCKQTEGVVGSVKDQLQASATGHVGVTPNGQGGYEATAIGQTGAFGYDVYGEVKAGIRKSVPKVEELPVAPATAK